MSLSSNWNNEAYVKVHLVEEILMKAGIPKTGISHWYPEFPITIPKPLKKKLSPDKVDFLVEDYKRNIQFLVEIKSAKTRIDNGARFQLSTYLRHSAVRFGILIDPFSLEIYEFIQGQLKLKDKFPIKAPTEIEPVATFLRQFLETVKMRIIAVHTSKGGVGKTTLVVNFAYELARRNNRVLVVDLDDQANASLSLGVNKADEIDKMSSLQEFKQILESFENRKEVIDSLQLSTKDASADEYRHCIQPASNWFNVGSKIAGKIDVLPSSYRTKPDVLSSFAIARKFLDFCLKKLAGDYDYVVIDTAPSYNLIAWNALYAAKYVIIPSQMEYLSAYGIKTTVKNIEEIRNDTGKTRCHILGIVPMMTEKKNNLNVMVEEFVKSTFPEIPILPRLSRSTYVGQASSKRMPLSLYAENQKQAGSVAMQLMNLTDELVKQIDSKE